jgi:hypothetical protein
MVDQQMIARIFGWLTAGMSDAASASVAAALIAFLGVALSALVSLAISRRTGYVSAVTVERARWINSLRENIAAYSGRVQALVQKIESESADVAFPAFQKQRAERIPFINDIDRLQALIRLQVNLNGEIDRNIILILEKMRPLAEGNASGELNKAGELLIAHSQWLLKAEWETVKAEAGMNILPFIRRFEVSSRLKKYRVFCDGVGRIKTNNDRTKVDYDF